MNRKLFFGLASAIALAPFLYSFNQQNQIGTFERLDPAVNEILGPNPLIEEISNGYAWTEGTLWIEEKKMLLFSDIPNNRIMKWTPEKGAEVYLSPAGYTGTAQRGGETGSNGLLLNKKGQLVLCQHGDRRMALMDAPLDKPAAKFIPLTDNYMGKSSTAPMMQHSAVTVIYTLPIRLMD